MVYGRRTTPRHPTPATSTRPLEPRDLEETVKESHVSAPAARRQGRPSAVRRPGGQAMRWVRFDAGESPRIARLDGDVVLPVDAERIQDVIAGRGIEPDGLEL